VELCPIRMFAVSLEMVMSSRGLTSRPEILACEMFEWSNNDVTGGFRHLPSLHGS
jgi:hypothetical protein